MSSSTKYRFMMDGKLIYIDYVAGDIDMIKTARQSGNFSMQQCTGLKDENDADVYEGDILDDGGVIEYRNDLNWDSGGSIHGGFFSTKGYEYGDDGCLSYHYQIVEHKVIGNIYENPELIK